MNFKYDDSITLLCSNFNALEITCIYSLTCILYLVQKLEQSDTNIGSFYKFVVFKCTRDFCASLS